MAFFMSSVIWVLSDIFDPRAVSGTEMKKGLTCRPDQDIQKGYQYILGGSCWLRRRLCWRFTAAASLRLRSWVGFS